MMKKLPVFLFVLVNSVSFAQQNDFNLIYYANQGVSGLAGANKVYMYSGAVTSSPSGSWEWIVGSPNLDDGVGLMTSLGNDTWTICIDPFVYYSSGPAGPIPNGSTIFAIDMFFRNENGTAFGYDFSNNYIIVDMTTIPPSSSFSGVVPGVCGVGNEEIPLKEFVMNNFPNPLESSTLIMYYLKNSANSVRVNVYDAIGQKVRTIADAPQVAGVYRINWNGDNDKGALLKNGVYLYTLEVNGKVLKTNRMIISR
jgi:hypothetical protein